jgi:ribosomal protein S3AE
MKSMVKKTTKTTESLVSVKTVDGSLLRGKINLGDEKRVSDIFIQSESPFIVLYDVFSQSVESKVMIINKNHIVWIEPEENATT